MGEPTILIKDKVPKDWIDYNGHMNDAAYARAFSWSVDRFMKWIGITDDFREQTQYTIFTMENHICYLDEMNYGESFEIHMQVIDYDDKRVHLFYELIGENKKYAATCEQMLMGIDQTAGKAAPFPDAIFTRVKELAKQHTLEEKPKIVGRVIGIRRT
ncbi:thioesterase family protein [Lentibacillus sp. N15]|uniref:thioesterase family protein n=1 Tax=Lentibacillus songyuanensis TaxID=3136161 RepID=UPI0031B9DF8A